MKTVSNFLINPISTLIATCLTFINFLIISIPFYIALIPILFYIKKEKLFFIPENIYFYILVIMFICTILYLFLDMLFGFTIKKFLCDTIEINDNEEFQVYQNIFDETLQHFDIKNVKFRILESDEVNAYAVASFRKRYVVVTTGMLSHIAETFDSTDDRKSALKGLIGHELSHLINWDFLPNLILISGQNISFYIGRTLELVIGSMISIFRIIPIVGAFFAITMTLTYNLLNIGLNTVYNYIIHPLYTLVERYLGRLVEYRSDYQSAQALSWEPMYLSLYSLLSLSGNTYHSSFSTHPNTISRVLNIYQIPKSGKCITVSFLSKYFGLILIASISFLLTYVFLYKSEFITVFIKKLNSIGSLDFNYLVKLFYNVKSDVLNYYSNIKSLINIDYPMLREFSTYFFLFIVFIICIYLIKYFLFKVKLKKTLDNSNKSENTPIDILLYYAVENDDIHSFMKVLKHGANINTTNFEKNIFEFAKEVNPKFVKYLNK